LDFYRDIRDATSEALLFQTYGNLFSLYLADKHEAEERRRAPPRDPRQLPFVRAGYLLAHHGEPLPLAWLDIKEELLQEYREL
jgi:hypothetical protein